MAHSTKHSMNFGYTSVNVLAFSEFGPHQQAMAKELSNRDILLTNLV